mmetsp:Transcript_8333/g.25820  ORF Transcript_8333/g.25820 Transcript_8333/m.25820 type:complete len:257 (+) Transcript_8333:1221-1991(+)
MSSTPSRRRKAWSSIEEPPTTVQERIDVNLASLPISWWICVASSRVGAITRPSGPSSARFAMRAAGSSETHWIIGMAKAAVFPEPVSATPMTSRRSRPTGTAWRWIGDGSLKPSSVMARRSSAQRPASSQLRKGGGARPPRTRMSKSSFMMRQSRSLIASSGFSDQCESAAPSDLRATRSASSSSSAASRSLAARRCASRADCSDRGSSRSSRARSSACRFSASTLAKSCRRRCSRMSSPATYPRPSSGWTACRRA